MKKILGLAVVVIVLFAAGIIYYKVNVSPKQKEVVASEVKQYLIEIKSYKQSDLVYVEGHYDKDGKYRATVRYSDEPNVNYTYENANGKFKLSGTSNTNGKHMDASYYQ